MNFLGLAQVAFRLLLRWTNSTRHSERQVVAEGWQSLFSVAVQFPVKIIKQTISTGVCTIAKAQDRDERKREWFDTACQAKRGKDRSDQNIANIGSTRQEQATPAKVLSLLCSVGMRRMYTICALVGSRDSRAPNPPSHDAFVDPAYRVDCEASPEFYLIKCQKVKSRPPPPPPPARPVEEVFSA